MSKKKERKKKQHTASTIIGKFFCLANSITFSTTGNAVSRLPRPGPMTNASIRSNDSKITSLSYDGCTISSGLYPLITLAASAGQKTCTISHPLNKTKGKQIESKNLTVKHQTVYKLN